MKQTILTTLSLAALACVSTNVLCEGSPYEAAESDSANISAKIGKIDQDRNILSIYGIDYCYSEKTRIVYMNGVLGNEYNLSPGTPVTLIRDPRSERRNECVKSLSEVIIGKRP